MKRAVTFVAGCFLLATIAACQSTNPTPTGPSSVPPSAPASTTTPAPSTPAPTATDTATPAPTDSPSPSLTATPSQSQAPSLVSPQPTTLPPETGSPTKVQSDYGPIWDRIPAGFPIYPGLEPVSAADPTPWSARLGISGVSAPTLANWYVAVLTERGFSHQPLRGPLEDHSLWLTASGTGGCSITIAFVPGDTMAQVLVGYGAACTLS